jgi:16S rRNA (adenine1518-N6/adenine1519-N6)-dimethyltransferase
MSTPRPRKRLGQHFLHDPAVINRIVTLIAPQRDDLMIEIGGGPGALTRPLLSALEHLHVVEVDARFAEGLRQLSAYPERLTVHHRDALTLDLGTLVTEDRKLRIVGNLPYNISTPLLFHFLKFRELVHDMHFMLQKEVVARMTALPGNKSYGRLTVMLSAWTDIDACFDIGPGAFKPPPKVRSTIVRIRPRQERRFPIEDEGQFARIVSKLFSMRRKTLARILRDEISRDEIEAAGFDPRARPETLSAAAIARLASLCGHAQQQDRN